MKKVWKYFIISILLLIGLCCVGLLYLFFVPGSSLFNICYISYNNTYKSEQYANDNIKQIVLNSQGYDVKILPSSNSTIYAIMYTNSFGFTTLDHKRASVDAPIIENNSITFNIDEPEGALLSTKSYVELYIPSVKDKSYDLKISNDHANVTINSSKIVIDKLTYNTNNGSLNISNASIIGNINLSLGNSYFYLNDTVKLNQNNVNISVTTGKFDSSKVTLGNVNIEKNQRGVIVVGNCKNLNENASSAGGRISVNTVSESLTLISSDTNLYANTVGTATISLSKSGKVSIKNLAHFSSITTAYGYIDIDNCYSNITLVSTYGDITIDNAYKLCDITSSYGNVNINYSDTAEGYTAESNFRRIDALIKNGKLTAKGVENINVTVSGNARLDIKMQNVKGTNVIKTNKGSVKIEVNATSVYTLTTSAGDNGSVNVNLLQIDEFGGYTSKDHPPVKVNGGSDQNILDVSATSGSIKIIDSELAKLN